MCTFATVRAWVALGFIGALTTSACTSEEAKTVAEPTRGSRLVPLYRSALTSQIFSGWFDTELQIDCRMEVGADGKTRCMPDGHSITSFQDPTCQGDEVALTCKPERFVSTREPGGFTTAGFELSPLAAAAGAPPLFLLGQNGCQAASDILGPTPPEAVVSTRTAVAAERFVEMREAVLPLNDALDLLVLEGVDGTQSPLGLRDRVRGAPCTIQWTDTGRRCLPSSYSEAVTQYADAGCTMPVLSFELTFPPFVMAVPDPGAPAAAPTIDPFGRRAKALFRFEAAPETTRTFVKTPAGCFAIPRNSAAPAKMVAVERLDTRVYPKIDPPTRSVSSDSDFDVDGQRVVLASRPDRMLRGRSGSCWMTRMSDGRWACRDAAHVESTYAADPGCSRQLALFQDPFVVPKRLLLTYSDGGICAQHTSRVVRLKQLPSDVRLFVSEPDSSSMCAPAAATPHPGHAVFELGEESDVTADGFVVGEPAAKASGN